MVTPGDVLRDHGLKTIEFLQHLFHTFIFQHLFLFPNNKTISVPEEISSI